MIMAKPGNCHFKEGILKFWYQDPTKSYVHAHHSFDNQMQVQRKSCLSHIDENFNIFLWKFDLMFTNFYTQLDCIVTQDDFVC
jgi:hypothetical protein